MVIRRNNYITHKTVVSEIRPHLLDSYNNSSTTLSVTVTATPTNGNYLFAQLTVGNFNSSAITTPAGWNLLYETVNSFGRQVYFVKQSDGSETSVTFSKTDGNGQIFIASIHEFENVSGYESLVTTGRTSSTLENIGSVTSTSDNSLAIFMISLNNINNSDDSITVNPSDYAIQSSYSGGLDGWNILATQEVESGVINSDSITFSASAVKSSVTLVLNP